VTEGLESALRALLTGIGATAVLDIWSLFLKRLFGIPSSNWSRPTRTADAGTPRDRS
jgi:hypothetical protein